MSRQVLSVPEESQQRPQSTEQHPSSAHAIASTALLPFRADIKLTLICVPVVEAHALFALWTARRQLY
jgi:hypothetical protein